MRAHKRNCRNSREIFTPQRGSKRSFLDLVESNAKHSFEQRFRVLKPSSKTIGEAMQNALNLPEEPQRIESFDISHIQGTDTVASMVVWENGRMKKSDYRKFIIRGDEGRGEDSNSPLPIAASPIAQLQVARLPIAKNDDFASMREAVTRRYRRLQEEKKPLPNLILIDGGIGQLHAAAQALDSLQVINQPLASIAKKEEILYVFGQEDEPIVLEHHSPVLHLIQQIRDETHRFAVTFHRQRRAARQTKSALTGIPGIGPRTAQKLLREFGSVSNVRRAGLEKLSEIIPRKTAEKLFEELGELQSQLAVARPLPEGILRLMRSLPPAPAMDALRREIKEETNLDVGAIEFALVQDCIHSKEFYRDAHFVLLNYTCRCDGEVQVKLNDEAREFRWVTVADALEMPINQPTRKLLLTVSGKGR